MSDVLPNANPVSGDELRAVEDGIAIAVSLLGTAMEARAAAVIAKLIERFPRNARAHLAQADLLRRAGRLREAAQAAQRALACDPDDALAVRLAAALHGKLRPEARPIGVPAPIWLVDDLLDAATHRQMLELALAYEPRLAPSSVGGINPHADWRRSKVEMAPDAFRTLAIDAVVAAGHRAVGDFGLEEFPFDTVEAQFTAHGDGDFYKAHRDWGEGGMEHRRLSFVYYFNRQPRGFSGGGLVLYDSLSDGMGYSAQSHSLVEPRDNMLIIFPARFWHEVQKVSCPSGAYGDSRFTMNGWIGVARSKKPEAAAP